MANLATTQYVGHKTSIPGLLFFDVSQVNDERGFFQEKYQKAKLVEAGMPNSFNVVQNSLSYNKEAGVTRGFHAEPWEKYITVVKGKVFGAWVDLRKGSSFGNVETFTITPNTAVFLPRGVANSFQTQEPDTYYLYSVSAHWSADNYSKYCFVNLSDPKIGINWPIPLEKSIINSRDQNHPILKDVKPMEI